jgi:hypothetical protein
MQVSNFSICASSRAFIILGSLGMVSWDNHLEWYIEDETVCLPVLMEKVQRRIHPFLSSQEEGFRAW